MHETYLPPRAATIAIVGGGIGGLSAAIALRYAGFEARVYERAPAFGEVGAGISLWPNATRALPRLGVLDRLRPHTGPIHALNVRAADGRVLLRARTDAHADRDTAPSLCAYRPALIDALRSALPDNACHTGKQLVRLGEHADGVALHFADDTTAEADLVVGADGIRSRVRVHVTGDDTPPVYRGYPVWRGIGPLPASFETGEIFETWGGGTGFGGGLRFGLLEVGPSDDGVRQAYWYATAARPAGGDSGDATARKAELLDLFADWHAPIPEAIASTPATAILRGDTYDRPPRRGWHTRRVVLLGDAIHPTTPNLGQGAGMAIEDALVLTRCLTEHAAPEAAFEAFEAERHARTARVTRESLWTGRLGLLGGASGRARNAATRLFPSAAYERNLDRLFSYTAYVAVS
ncbi:MAG: FAD-dependent monooxygenase [Bacteroidota bacterium]